jgi:hypothetical protein
MLAHLTRKATAVGLLAAVASCLVPGSAAASQIFVLDTLVTGTPSANQGGGGIFTIQATTVGSNAVRLDFTTNLGPQEYISNVFMNLAPALNTSQFSTTHLSGATANAVAFTHNGAIFNGTFASFDVRFGFPTVNGSRLGNPSGSHTNFTSSSYLVTYNGTGIFTENSFNFRSAHGPNHPEAQYFIGANVQGIQPGGRSGKYVQSTPEPGSIVLLGGLAGGLVGFVGLRRLVRRRSAG